MSLGFEQAGFDVIAAADIEKVNVETYSSNFPTSKTLRADLSTLTGQQFRSLIGIGDRKIDVAFAGPPCQGFSLIGKRVADDPRNLLLYDLARLLPELAPTYFVVENVKGIMLGTMKGILDEFVARVERAGYSVVRPIQILDAAEYGVPQHRERMFLLGYKSGCTGPKYPEPTVPQTKDGEYPGPTVWDAIGDLPNVSRFAYLLDHDEFRGELGKPSAYARKLREPKSAPESNQNAGQILPITGCLRTRHSDETILRFSNTEQGKSEAVSRFHRLCKSGLAHTIRAGTGPEHGSFMAPRPIHPTQNRCITVREAARLHSFPDWFQFHRTKWHGFRQVGNSVPPLLAHAIANSVLAAWRETNEVR